MLWEINSLFCWLSLIVVLYILIYQLDGTQLLSVCFFRTCIVRRHNSSELHSNRPQAKHDVWILSHGDKKQTLEHMEHDRTCHHIRSRYVRTIWLQNVNFDVSVEMYNVLSQQWAIRCKVFCFVFLKSPVWYYTPHLKRKMSSCMD